MATTPTNLPIPSESPKDLRFNAGKIDEFVNALTLKYIDRFGIERFTAAGLENLVREIVGNLGWVPFGTFEDGATLTDATQTLKYEEDGNYYRWDGEFHKEVPESSTPESTGGVAQGAWVNVTDMTLRSFLFSSVVGWITPEMFGAAGDGVTDDSAAFIAVDEISISTGKPVFLLSGGYYVKNVELGGTYKGFNGAKIITEISSLRDNMVIVKSGFKIDGVTFDFNYINGISSGGNYGYIFRVGDYYQELDGSSLIKNVEITNCIFNFDESSSSFAVCIEVLGNVRHCLFKGITFNGNCNGIITHWGGDVDVENPDSSLVTYSWHPNNISIEDITHNGSRTAVFQGANITLAISASFDIRIRNVRTDYSCRTLWIYPGDVYEEVVVAEQAGRVMTGIDVDGVYFKSHHALGSAYPIHLDGYPSASRTAATRSTAIDETIPMNMTLVNINGHFGPGDSPRTAFYGKCLKNVYFSGGVTGLDDKSLFWGSFVFCQNITLTLTGASKQGLRTALDSSSRVHINSKVINTDGSYLYGISSSSYSAPFTLTEDLAVGATEIKGTCSSSSDLFFNGAILVNDGNIVSRITKSVLGAVSSSTPTTIKIEPSSMSLASGTTINMHNANGGRFTGKLDGYRNNIYALNASDMMINMSIIRSWQYGVNLDGSFCHNVKVSESDFKGTGSLTTNAIVLSCNDIYLSSPAIYVSNLSIFNNSFDESSLNPYVKYRFGINSSLGGGYIQGVSIYNNIGTQTNGTAAISIVNSNVAKPRCANQIYGNSFGTQTIVANDVYMGQYMGAIFIGSYRGGIRPQLKSTGYHQPGDIIYNGSLSSYSAYPDIGWICRDGGLGTASVWLSLGLITSLNS